MSTGAVELMAQGLLFRNERTKGWMTDSLSDAESVKSGYTLAGSASGAVTMVLYGVPDYIFEEQLGDLLASANLCPTTFSPLPWNPGTSHTVAWKVIGLEQTSNKILTDYNSDVTLMLISTDEYYSLRKESLGACMASNHGKTYAQATRPRKK